MVSASPLRPAARPSAPFAPADGLSLLRARVADQRSVGVAALPQLLLDCQSAMAVHAAISAAGIESFVLTTCNRTEIAWCARAPGDDARVRAACAAAGAGALRLWDAATPLAGADVAAHLFRVASGLESLVQGEAEILGQVRAALDACSGAGPLLRGVVQGALRTGRMARAETAIGVGAQSVASAAVQLVAAALPTEARVLVVGAGATGIKLLTHLRAAGITDLLVANRSEARADAAAAAAGAATLPLAAVSRALTEVDAAFFAVHTPAPLVSRVELLAAAAARRRPLIVSDISMPPAVDAAEAPGVTRLGLADIEAFVAAQQHRRAAEVPAVERVIARELAHLDVWVRRQALRPLVAGLRRRVETIRRQELARAEAELARHPGVDAALLDRLSRRLLTQVFAQPLASLEHGTLPLDDAQAVYLHRLFGLDDEGRA